MTEPLLRHLHARGERLVVAALPWVAPVYRAMPQVAEVVELSFGRSGLQWSARRAMARALRGRFDVAYVCPNSFKSALIPWWAGIARRVGYHGEARRVVLNVRLPNAPRGVRAPMVDHYCALAFPDQPTASAPRLQPDPVQVAADLATLNRPAQSYYVFAPGAEYGPAKRWPSAHFAALARGLPLPVVLLGSAKDAAVCAEIATQVRTAGGLPCINLAGHTPLNQALSIISAAKAVVSNDSGLMHVAAALGVPQVAVFGSSSPLHTPPLNARATVFWLKNDAAYQPALDCAPCFDRICALGHTRCLADIKPATVLAAVP